MSAQLIIKQISSTPEKDDYPVASPKPNPGTLNAKGCSYCKFLQPTGRSAYKVNRESLHQPFRRFQPNSHWRTHTSDQFTIWWQQSHTKHLLSWWTGSPFRIHCSFSSASSSFSTSDFTIQPWSSSQSVHVALICISCGLCSLQAATIVQQLAINKKSLNHSLGRSSTHKIATRRE